MIKIKNLNFSYDNKNKIINNLTLNINKGSFVCLIGHNGCGKSTLAKLLCAILNYKSGEIKIDDIKVCDKTKTQIQKKVGLVFQNPDNQFVGANVLYDISFGLENECLERDEILKKVYENAKLTGVSELLEKSPEELSGGQKQRVAIAGLLALNKDLFIFDEATSMLDKKGKDKIFTLIKKIKEQGKTVILITHDIMLALKTERIIVLKKGEIFADLLPCQIMDYEEKLKESMITLPMPLRLLKELENKNDYDKIKKLLWEYTLKM